MKTLFGLRLLKEIDKNPFNAAEVQFVSQVLRYKRRVYVIQRVRTILKILPVYFNNKFPFI